MASLCCGLNNQIDEFELGEAQRFSYLSLQAATNKFADYNLVGVGRFAKIYRGVLPNGTLIAVRKYRPESKYNFASPPTVEILSRIRHPNINRVIGYCYHKNHCLLVSEYMSNGSLHHLIINKERRESAFNWPMRVAVCNGIARGLHHLHHETSPYVIHRGMSPSKVLFDSNFTPKLTGFDIAKFVYESPLEEEKDDPVEGTDGYRDPEYLITRKSTPKCDVYGFGLVMLEIITGRTVWQILYSDEYTERLPSWALRLSAEDRALEVVDPVLADFPVDQVLSFIHVALSCVKYQSRLRPTMGDVIQMLNQDTPYLSAGKLLQAS